MQWRARAMHVRRRLHTLASTSEVRGVGLHSGVLSRVRLRPAAIESGICFVRADMAGAAPIPARLSSVVSTTLSTTLGGPDANAPSVSTVEHLMAALCGLGVTSCLVEVDAPELPVLDGSAAPWVEAIRAAGLTRATSQAGGAGSSGSGGGGGGGGGVQLDRSLRVEEGGSWVVAVPAASPQLTVGIDFPSHSSIGRQWATWRPHATWPAHAHVTAAELATAGSFASSVAPARTFCRREDLDEMRSRGLIKGGSLENALVCDATDGWLNGSGLRFVNEPARHKLLDLIGDLALLPGHALPSCHVVAYCAGHRLHVELGRAIERELGTSRDA